MLTLLTLSLLPADLSEQAIADAIETVQSIETQAGNQAAVRDATAALAGGGPDVLVPIVRGMANEPLADNWLRGAFEMAAAAAIAEGSLPTAELRQAFEDTDLDPRARRMVYELLREQDAAAGLEPRLDDPSAEMRRDAVAAILEAAEDAGGDEALTLYRQALQGATDPSQVDAISEKLAEAGEPVDLLRHYGYLTEWKLVGPFENKDEASFDVAFEPETAPQFEAEYETEFEGQPLVHRWQTATIEDESGTVDLHQLMANHKGSLVYAAAAFESAEAQPIELRLSTANAWKLWLNGELLFARPEYHRGKKFDQYVVRSQARAGRNVVLIKLLQNEQEQSWAQDYDVSVRVTEPTGLAAQVQPQQP